MKHEGKITEYKMNTPAYRFKYVCGGCQWQSYQPTLKTADEIGKQHQSQFTPSETTS